ncbi:glucose/sorbosone dehydrogenase family protein [Alkalidesulfovibrio alkalitolerans DSM 16529]|jgi:glucose/arabinose dehydrogenase|uniref:Glucose/sorbosone dehydrogenase family protein n=1 Tax=Alkalidesulfovibrio alkalitolerans DSM 16529 TaxID=1121439 RepID=S7T1W1_9BACT|nr:PQQ-dependent sugar dehydrogenase [Alkalidesulfovibrio alkalitolerans]EPR30505.1 glucose/sorbosone dehydrogenase family protein [Alkalidesulfovibrio alkalitolerans DSM 16529]
MTRRTLISCLFVLACLFPATFTRDAQAYDVWGWLRALSADHSTPLVEASNGGLRVDVVVEGLESPWGMVFLPDGRILVTERPGRLRVVANGVLLPDPLPGVPEVSYRGRAGQGGLLDIALHPGFARNSLIYLAYTVDTPEGEMTCVSRHVLGPKGLSQAEIVFPGFPGGKNSKHFGSRIAFGRDGMLYVTLGERGEGRRAQDLMDLNGKTLRLKDDGSIPQDNPFVGVENARPEIFTYGNRNSQGMAVHPETGMIVQTEHGPTWNDAPGGGDEVNIIKPGLNYGWPVIHHRQTSPGMIPPLLEYTPAIAPAGAAFLTGDLFPGWRHDFFFACLRGEKLVRVKFDGETPVEQEFLLEGKFGRLRDVSGGPDGALYVLTSSTDAYGPGRTGGDMLLRLSPADR